MPTTCRCQFISFFTRGANCLLVAQLARAHCHLPKKERSFLCIAGNHSNPRLPTRLKSANVFHLRAVTLSIATSHSSTGETDMIPVIFMQASMRQGTMFLIRSYVYLPTIRNAYKVFNTRIGEQGYPVLKYYPLLLAACPSQRIIW